MREIQTTANSLNLKKHEILAPHFQVNPQYSQLLGNLNPDYNNLYARQIPNGMCFPSHNMPDSIRDIKLVSFALSFTTLCNEEPSADDLEN